jgi:ATP phosphoribosyltransferase
MIKLALPNKGVLFEPTLELLSSCGYRVGRAGGALVSLDRENNVEFYFLRPADIPVFVANGLLDGGITGKDFVAEKGLDPTLLVDLNNQRPNRQTTSAICVSRRLSPASWNSSSRRTRFNSYS